MSTDCHRYLSRFVGISSDTIDILVENGIDSVHTLRAINMDEDWHRLPTQISIGQKLLLRHALATLSDITDDDYDGNKQEITARRSVANNKTDTVLDYNRKSCKEIESNSCQQLLQQTIDASDQQFVSNDKHCNQSLNTRRVLRFHKKEIHIIDNIEKEMNAKQSVYNTRSKQSINLDNNMDTVLKDNRKKSYKDIQVNSSKQLCLHKIQTNDGRFICNYDNCNKSFKAINSMRRHKKTVHSTKRPFVCNYDDCYKKYKNKQSLIQHKKCIHSSGRPFLCNYDDCNQSFKLKSILVEHQKQIHTTDRPFVCHYNDCNKSFKSKSNLGYHLKYVHSTHRLFICNYNDCKKAYKTKSNLIKHQKCLHSIDRPFVCNYKGCDKSFKLKQRLIEHQKYVHTSDRPFVCNYKDCDKTYKCKKHLIGHQKLIHQIVKP